MSLFDLLREREKERSFSSDKFREEEEGGRESGVQADTSVLEIESDYLFRDSCFFYSPS